MSELQAQTLTTSIEHEMRTSFIDYAMSVIISRALPNVRDGLKPVHRRILYAMHVAKNFHNQPYKKSARIVGEVMGRFHPHGDQAIYDALVRMAQDFSLRYTLTDGQGNFGSIDGDPPAAMRYTEIRMDRIGSEMLADIEKDTVDWTPVYDEKEDEPVILPARIPNLLVNGSQGIAVGMATNIPPHNIIEVINGTIALLNNPKMTLSELMEFIPGPDFPTAGTIYGRGGVVRAYKTGKGVVIMRGVTEFEEFGKRKRTAIIVSELPYQVNKARLLEKIAGLVKDKKIEGISDLRDESDRNGIRMVIELKRDAVPEIVLNQLYKQTQLQDSFGINMLAIVDGRPRILTLRDVLWKFVEHRRDVVTRRSAYELREAQKRAHILEGLKTALDHLDEVIALIRKSNSPSAAREALMERFEFSQPQAQAILDMRLQRLTALERDKILAELAEIQARIQYLQELLADSNMLTNVIVQEMEEVRDTYGDERRTQIVDATGQIEDLDLIAEEDMVVTVSHLNYIKRNPISLYRAQRRGGKGVAGMANKDDDFVRELFIANSHDFIMLFTNTGRVYIKRVYEIPEAGRTARGRAIVNLLDLRPGETVSQLLAIEGFQEGMHVVLATRKGVIKKTKLMDFTNIRSTGIIAIDLVEDDELIDVRLTDGSSHVLLSTHQGFVIRFPEENVRAMGRTARGVRGIKLRQEDVVVQMSVLPSDSEASVVTVCEHGYGKRTAASEFPLRNRGGMGVIGIKTTDRNGQVVGTQVVTEEDQLMMITNVGKVIRTPVSDISIIGRATQGVRLIRLEEAEEVLGMERLAEPDDEDEIEGEGEGEETKGEDAATDGAATDEAVPEPVPGQEEEPAPEAEPATDPEPESDQ